MRKLPPLSALRAFEAAARRGGFKAAAEELNVTPTAISHQIRQLEDWLGVKLFERRTRSVRLTDGGTALFPALRDGFDSFERAIETTRNLDGGKVATLTSTVAFTAKCLAARAGGFRAAYPDWTLRLDATNAVVDLDRSADASIRYGPGYYAGLVSELLFKDHFAPVCRPHLTIATAQDLQRATLIHFDWGAAVRDDPRAITWAHWLGAAGMSGIDPNAGLRFNDEIHAMQATLAGQGVGLISLTLVADELANGTLVQPFDLALESFQYDLVYSPRSASRQATAILKRWVRGEFADADAPERVSDRGVLCEAAEE
ncbi:LysR family transcriptional regulator [Burkholderia multivorans]|uniref:LysR substrate-binding domain-containing protein n=1 Tax=Burkholderia multivorans TaxID=87883 RepID=UPI00143E2A45|nr:LysR substrate-binding domain-containing protein [Burkholderia multivorans]MBU9467647.1 LysR family transcriptional regulator [Burkholderia multivorans]MCA8129509.1 LysR family transcriptional regulator [Burkholderia multivorans]QIX15644.1 LysR family transcriptional regulator [Burkholderia multivorans]